MLKGLSHLLWFVAAFAVAVYCVVVATLAVMVLRLSWQDARLGKQ